MAKSGILKTLYINEKWQICSDSHNWIVREKVITKNNASKGGAWYVRGAFPRLDQALRKLCNEDLKEAKTLGEIEQRIFDLEKLIDSIDLDSQISYKE